MPDAHGGKRAPKNKRAKRGDKKRHYLNAALELFAQLGYSNINFDQIAESAGVSRSTLTRSFPDKPSILQAIGEEWLSTLFPEEDAIEASSIAAVNLMLDFSQRFLRSLTSKLPTAQVILTGLTESAIEEEASIVRDMLQRVVDRLAPIIQEGQQAGVLRRGLDPKQTAGDWTRFLLGAAILPFPEPGEGDVPTQVIDTLLHGILKTDV